MFRRWINSNYGAIEVAPQKVKAVAGWIEAEIAELLQQLLVRADGVVNAGLGGEVETLTEFNHGANDEGILDRG